MVRERWCRSLSYLYGVDAMSDRSTSRIAIVGAGQAAAQAVETLHKRGHTGLDHADRRRRPAALSTSAAVEEVSGWHAGSRSPAHPPRGSLRWSMAIDLRLGFAAVGIDRARRRVEIADGSVRRIRRAAAGHRQPSAPVAIARRRAGRRVTTCAASRMWTGCVRNSRPDGARSSSAADTSASK